MSLSGSDSETAIQGDKMENESAVMVVMLVVEYKMVII